jgi:peptidoglycan/xylan/chitin deacetylase (PgdA/CDA1 family)
MTSPETFHWPDGVRAAASVTFDVDAESAILADAPEAAARLSVMTHQAYGPRTGVPRLLRILERRGVRATFFVPGHTADRFPDAVRAIRDAGHELGHHGYCHEPVFRASAEEEETYLLRGLDALDRIAGVRPAGYRAPWWETTYRTPALLARHGFLYDSSLMDADRPYLLDARNAADVRDGGPATDLPRGDRPAGGVGPGSGAGLPGGDRPAGAGRGPGGAPTPALVEIPIQWGLDDWEQYAFLPGLTGSGVIESPAKVLEMWALELEAQVAEGGCFVLTMHPFLTGRASRAAALDRLLERMTAIEGLWIAPLVEIAEHVATLGLPPVRHTQPDVDARPQAGAHGIATAAAEPTPADELLEDGEPSWR